MSAAAAPPPTRTTLDPAVAIPAAAEHLFELTRTSEPPAAVSATAAPAADRWDGFYKARVDPAVRVLVPTLVVLAVLLVLARALTPYVVRPAARAWDQARRAAAWATGFVLLVVAATAGGPSPWVCSCSLTDRRGAGYRSCWWGWSWPPGSSWSGSR